MHAWSTLCVVCDDNADSHLVTDKRANLYRTWQIGSCMSVHIHSCYGNKQQFILQSAAPKPIFKIDNCN